MEYVFLFLILYNFQNQENYIFYTVLLNHFVIFSF
uniref:PBCV-1 capsid-measure protein, minor capsid proteins.5A n=1 Tax=Siphoviridae sp. ctwQT14 TaxID=2827971 RepID=A0A8S5TJT8_9CAUD|nr:MAG TPA: PBCV-1 capsid-measure protein, minor capsid proteins.5A [Siphoviridae sp. ctwQT14]